MVELIKARKGPLPLGLLSRQRGQCAKAVSLWSPGLSSLTASSPYPTSSPAAGSSWATSPWHLPSAPALSQVVLPGEGQAPPATGSRML